MKELKEIEYRGQIIKVFYGSHMGDHFFCSSNHLSSSHNENHINGGWETIDIAIQSIKDNIDKWLDNKINSIDELSREIIKALVYSDEYNATINNDVLQILIDKYNS